MTKKGKTLGRGLSSLICKEDFDELLEKPYNGHVTHARIEDVCSNENQPRKHFGNEALEELTSSIRKNGIISPILVRKRTDGKLEIIAGERRYRAASLAGSCARQHVAKGIDRGLRRALITRVRKRIERNQIDFHGHVTQQPYQLVGMGH